MYHPLNYINYDKKNQSKYLKKNLIGRNMSRNIMNQDLLHFSKITGH